MTGQLASFIVSPRTTVLSLTKPASAGTSPRQIPYWGTWQKKHYVDSSWNVMEHVDAREGKWRWNWRMKWVASTLHTTSEHGVSSITTANAHTSAASSRLNWRPPGRFKWTRPFRRKTKSGFCACAITFQLASTNSEVKATAIYWEAP